MTQMQNPIPRLYFLYVSNSWVLSHRSVDIPCEISLTSGFLCWSECLLSKKSFHCDEMHSSDMFLEHISQLGLAIYCVFMATLISIKIVHGSLLYLLDTKLLESCTFLLERFDVTDVNLMLVDQTRVRREIFMVWILTDCKAVGTLSITCSDIILCRLNQMTNW